MDPELKILLEQLISAISTLGESDINMLAATIASATMTCWVSMLIGYVTYKLGKRQNQIAEQQAELQKRQCEIEEFDIYKEMHRDVYKLHQYSRLVLPAIYDYFASNTAKDQAQRVDELENVFNELVDKIAVDEADFMLRKGKNDLINEAFKFASITSFLLGIVTAYVKTNDRPEQSDIMALNAKRLQYKTDLDWIKAIAQYAPNDEALKATIRKFIKEKHLLFEVEDNLLERIRKSYKNEIN